MTSLVVPHRFRGPANSGNGGWTAGSYAELLGEVGVTVEVTLKQPPPLDSPIEVTVEPGRVTSAVADARIVEAVTDPVPAVAVAAARAAEASYPGWQSHPFPTCFSCGTGRDDGLRIFPGFVADGTVAATWTPTEVTVPITWAALDCSGAWAADISERALVLGRMTAQVDALPEIGRPYVVVGRHLSNDGRKVHTAVSLYDDAGHLLAHARQVWIEIDLATFNEMRRAE